MTILFGSSAEISTSANSPRRYSSARRTAFSSPIALHLSLDEVGDDLGVGLGDEAVAFLLELPLEIEVVLDDAVVHDDDPARAVAVRVRVLLGRPAVRRPARVADAVLAVERIDAPAPPRGRESLPGAAAQLDRAVAHDRDAGRVVAAILEPSQPVDEDGERPSGGRCIR